MSASGHKRTSRQASEADFGDDPKPTQFIFGRSATHAVRSETPLILRGYFAPSSTYSTDAFYGSQVFRGSTLSWIERTV